MRLWFSVFITTRCQNGSVMVSWSASIVCRTLEDWPRMRRSVWRQLRALPLPPGVPLTALLRAALVSHAPFLARRA